MEIQHNGANVGTEPALDFEDSGSVTWTVTDNPGVNVQVTATATGGAGLQFTANGVYGPANSGDALDVTTNGAAGPSGFGIALQDTAGNGIELKTSGGVGGGLIHLEVSGTDSELSLVDGDSTLRSSAKLTLEADTDLIGIADAGDIKFRPFTAGQVFEVLDHLGAPLLTLTA